MKKKMAIFCILWGSGIALAAHGQSFESPNQAPPLEDLDAQPALQIGENDVLAPFLDTLPSLENLDGNDEFFAAPAFNDGVEPTQPSAAQMRQQAERLSDRAMPPMPEVSYPSGPVGPDRFRLQQQMRDLSIYTRRHRADEGSQVPAWSDSPDTTPWSAEPGSTY